MEKLLYAGRSLLCIAFISLFATPIFCQPTVETLLARGDSIYRIFDYENALPLFQEALALDTTSFDARLKVARTSYDLGLDLLAADDRERAFTAFENSILHAETLVRQFPDSARAHFLLAAMVGNMALFKNGREKLLLGRLVELHSKQSIALDSTFAYPYVSLGIYYREISRLNWFEKTLASVLFGRIPEASIDEAMKLLQTALQLRPDFPFLQFELAKTLLSIDHVEEAIHHLETFVSLKPENAQDARNQDYAKKLIERLKSG